MTERPRWIGVAILLGTCLGAVAAEYEIDGWYRGGVFSGVLWPVGERTFVKYGQKVEPPRRWIVCGLFR